MASLSNDELYGYDPETYEPSPLELVLSEIDMMADRHLETAALVVEASPFDALARGRAFAHREAAAELRALAKRWSEQFPAGVEMDESSPF